jgi:putative alpha-1,2-mannosidase
MVPQNVSGLAAMMGNREIAAARLDAFFHNPDGSWAIGSDSLHYSQGNEPGMHAPWLYNALGQPWKTEETVRQIVDTQYGTGPSGLPGNDDLGAPGTCSPRWACTRRYRGAPRCFWAARSSRRWNCDAATECNSPC